MDYTNYGMVSRISRNGRVNAFKSAPDRARYEGKDTDNQGNLITVTHYLGNVERFTHTDGKVVYKCYLQTGQLGSLNVISDQWGNIVQELSCGAWGLRRSAVIWNDADFRYFYILKILYR